MNLLLQPGHARTSPALDAFIETRLLALADRQRIEEAVVRLGDDREASPRYQASILLRIPGPDLHAVACDHTLRGAVQRVIDAVEAQVAARQGRREARRRSRLQQSGAARIGRAW
ncbi:MAG: HPF/RaiA family ribosome-associated protein [Verrucomicrobia bacterium]|nr:HPF/RaiA family ribosome-associated protein [Verrucomicrobiota bacterium]